MLRFAHLRAHWRSDAESCTCRGFAWGGSKYHRTFLARDSWGENLGEFWRENLGVTPVFTPFVTHLSSPLLSLPSSPPPSLVSYARFLPILCESMLSHSPSPATPRPHHLLLGSFFLFDLIFLSRYFMIVILCCCFIFSSSVDSSCLLCKRCKLYSLNKEKILAQQSSLHFLIVYFLFLRALLHFKGSPLPLKDPSLALFDFTLVQDFLLHSLSQLLPAYVDLALVQLSQFFHFFRVFLHSETWLSFISSADHPSTFFFSLGFFTPLPS